MILSQFQYGYIKLKTNKIDRSSRNEPFLEWLNLFCVYLSNNIELIFESFNLFLNFIFEWSILFFVVLLVFVHFVFTLYLVFGLGDEIAEFLVSFILGTLLNGVAKGNQHWLFKARSHQLWTVDGPAQVHTVDWQLCQQLENMRLLCLQFVDRSRCCCWGWRWHHDCTWS